MQADALSTAFFIPAPETGLRLAESIPEIEACLIAQGKRMFRTKGWKKIIT
jgi:thiamine biosynthesis lipoprotein ApbE